MTEKNTINVKVTVNSDELREWAGRHANAGNHGVAHVLFQAAKDAESLSEQAIREAKAEAWEEARQIYRGLLPEAIDIYPNPYRENRGQA